MPEMETTRYGFTVNVVRYTHARNDSSAPDKIKKETLKFVTIEKGNPEICNNRDRGLEGAAEPC